MPQQSSLLFGNIAGEFLPTVSHGQGVHLFDVDGNRYFDGCAARSRPTSAMATRSLPTRSGIRQLRLRSPTEANSPTSPPNDSPRSSAIRFTPNSSRSSS